MQLLVKLVQVHYLTKHRACIENEQVHFYMMFVLLLVYSDIPGGVRYHTANSEPYLL